MSEDPTSPKASVVHRFSDLRRDYGDYGISSHDQIGVPEGATMAGGVAFFKDVEHHWTVWYNEVLICQAVEGRFEVEIEGQPAQEMKPGDMVWLPAGTKLIYRAVGEATMFFVVTPVDWAEKMPEALAGPLSE